MTARANLVGCRFGLLRVVEFSHVNNRLSSMWKCLCVCGGERTVGISELKKGDATACKSLVHRARKGQSRSHLYQVYWNMVTRCYYPSATRFSRYGGRGIKVCQQWLNDVGSFMDWATSGYRDGLTIDRINNDGNYEPGNCRWVTRKENSGNSRLAVIIEHNGKSQCISAWAREIGVDASVISRRRKSGFPVSEILRPRK